jgi:lipoyl(octanoyl) transferase
LRRSLQGHAATAEELAGRPISYEEAVAAMTAGFREALALDLTPGELTDAERAWAAELVRDRYGNAEWTART